MRRNRSFLFGYYEGFRNREGFTRAATVPSDAQRRGDFSGLRDPQTGQPVPLITYYPVLNVAILVIAWKKSWLIGRAHV